MDDSHKEPSSQRTELEHEDEDVWDNRPWRDSAGEEEQEEDVTEEDSGEDNAGDENDDPEVTRHVEAYLRMTELAKLGPPIRDRHSETPSRKRRKLEEVVDEITDSNNSSRFESLSPHSNAVRPSARLGTSEESRRYSAPSRMISPFKMNTPRKRPRVQDGLSSDITCKMEKRNTSSAWIIATTEQLRGEYPQDRISYEKEEFKCLDCDRLFKSGWGKNKRTTYSFSQHLGSKSHKDTQDMEREKLNEKEVAFPQCPQPCQHEKSSFLQYFPIAPPIQCFNMPNVHVGGPLNGERPLQGIRSTMMQCIDAMESDVLFQAKEITALKNQAVASQARNQKVLEEVRESMEAFEKSRTRQNEELDEKFGTSAARTNMQAAQHVQMAEKLDNVQTKTTAQLERTTELLRNLEASAKDHAKHMDHQFSTLRDNTEEDLENLHGKCALLRERNEDKFDKMMSEIRSLRESMEKQDDSIHDLESTLQIHTEQLQNQRENEDELRGAISAQIEEHSQSTRTHLDKMGKETNEKIRSVERQSEERNNAMEIEISQTLHALDTAIARTNELETKHEGKISALERLNEERINDVQAETASRLQVLEQSGSEQIKRLEATNDNLNANMKIYESLFASLFDGMRDMEGNILSLAEVAERPPHRQRSALTRPRVRRRRLGVRIGSRRGFAVSTMRTSPASTAGG